MDYTIIGTGGIGGYYGSRLAEHGHNVSFLFRSDYDYVVSNGLTVHSVKGDISLPKVKAYKSTSDMPKADVIIVCIKTTGNAALPDLIRPILKKDSIVILIQNGLGMEEELHEALPEARIAGATAFICTFKTAPGEITHTAYGELTLAPFTAGISAELEKICKDFEDSAVPCTLMEDYKLMRWKKLVWNIPYNGLSVILNAKTDALTFEPDARRLVNDLMNEVIDGAGACGVKIDRSFVDKMISMTETMAPYWPSMYLDYDAGRSMEIRTMYENPCKAASKAGFEMKITYTVMRELMFLNSTNKK